MARASEAAAPQAQDAVTDRRVLRIAVPIMLSNATVPILGVVDTAVVGQLGPPEYIGAVGIGAIILSGVYWIFGFLRMGTAGLVAQAHGAGDAAETGALLVRALMVAGAAGLFFILLQAPVIWAAFQISPASAEVERLATAYLSIRIWAAPGAIAVYALTGWLIALEKTRAVLVLQLWMNGLNIVLDVVFVLGLGWGVEGVALATFLAEWSGAALGLWLCRAAFSGDQWRDWGRIFDAQKLWRMAAVNTDIMIRSVLLEIGFVSFLFLGARFGDVVLAANQILLQLMFVVAYALDGFAFAAEALVGQAMGARNRARLRQGAVVTSKWGLIVVGVMSLGFLAFGGMAIDLMAVDDRVRAVTRDFLPWVIAAPALGIAAWMLDGIFIGATRTAEMRTAMLISFAIYLAALALLVPSLGNHGLWAAMMVFFVARGATLGFYYPRLEAGADDGRRR